MSSADVTLGHVTFRPADGLDLDALRADRIAAIATFDAYRDKKAEADEAADEAFHAEWRYFQHLGFIRSDADPYAGDTFSPPTGKASNVVGPMGISYGDALKALGWGGEGDTGWGAVKMARSRMRAAFYARRDQERKAVQRADDLRELAKMSEEDVKAAKAFQKAEREQKAKAAKVDKVRKAVKVIQDEGIDPRALVADASDAEVREVMLTPEEAMRDAIADLAAQLTDLRINATDATFYGTVDAIRSIVAEQVKERKKAAKTAA